MLTLCVALASSASFSLGVQEAPQGPCLDLPIMCRYLCFDPAASVLLLTRVATGDLKQRSKGMGVGGVGVGLQGMGMGQDGVGLVQIGHQVLLPQPPSGNEVRMWA